MHNNAKHECIFVIYSLDSCSFYEVNEYPAPSKYLKLVESFSDLIFRSCIPTRSTTLLTNNFSTFVQTQIPKLKSKLNTKVKKIQDKVLQIKLKEAINCVDKFCLNESKQTNDNSVVQLLRYYELDKELNKI